MMPRTRSNKTASTQGTVQSSKASALLALTLRGPLLPLISTQTFAQWF
jgi:hypothetical protein